MSYTNLLACLIGSRYTSVCPPGIWASGLENISISTVYNIVHLKTALCHAVVVPK